MECPLQSKSQPEILLDYCSDRLSPQRAIQVEEHIDTCNACRAFVDAQSEVWHKLDLWEPVEVSPTFDERLYARIQQDQKLNWLQRAWHAMTSGGMSPLFGWRSAMPVATACLTIVLALFLYHPQSVPVKEPANSKVVSAKDPVDVEQVETTLEDMEMLRQLNAAPPSANM